MVQPSAEAKAILDRIIFGTIATVSDDGQPWNTPVAAFHFPNDYTLYWASWKDNQHSQNIRANSKAFIVVYDSTPMDGEPLSGVYMLANATELTDEQDVMQAALVFGDNPFNSSDGKQYLGDKPRRIYKAVSQKIWMNGDSAIDGNFIDVRIEAEA